MVEVITAVYLTMCMDDVLKMLWTPRYIERVQHILDGVEGKLAESMQIKLKDHINSISYSIKKRLRVSSSFMIIACFLLLIIIGFEQHCAWFRVDNNEEELVLRVTTLFFIIDLSGGILLKSYSRLLVSIGIIICLAVVLYVHDFSLVEALDLDESMVRWFVIFLLICPILWQIVKCWAYSNLYYTYLNRRCIKEEGYYKAAKLACSTKQVGAAPEDYKRAALSDLDAVSSDLEQDIVYRNITEKFIERMDSVCTPPTLVSLLIDSIWNKDEESKKTDRNIISTEQKRRIIRKFSDEFNQQACLPHYKDERKYTEKFETREFSDLSLDSCVFSNLPEGVSVVVSERKRNAVSPIK